MERSFQSRHIEDLITLGQGAFGEVRLVKTWSVKRNLINVIKIIPMNSSSNNIDCWAERDSLQDLIGPRIVGLHSSFQDSLYRYLILEYLPGGDLMTLLIRLGKLAEPVTRRVGVEVARALGFIHSKGYIHRDIKPDNIMLDARGAVKLVDFGLCQKANDAMGTSSLHLLPPIAGTPEYMAPEVILRCGYSFSCDWWGLGVVLFECLVGFSPFLCGDQEEACRRVIRWQHFLRVPDEALALNSCESVSFILALIRDEQSRLGRYGVDEVQQHPWFKNVDWSDIDLEASSSSSSSSSSSLCHQDAMLDLYVWMLEATGNASALHRTALRAAVTINFSG